MRPPPSIGLELTPEQVEQIARRTAELLAARLTPTPVRSPYLSVEEAAEYLRTKRQRIDDLLSQEILTRIKDGHRTLIARAELEAYVRGDVRRERGARRAAA